MSAKPTLVLVHGAWHSPEYFTPLVSELATHGYKCVAVSLPSCAHHEGVSPLPALDADVAAVRAAVTAELATGTNVAVVAHSYGGVVAGSALAGLDAQSVGSDGDAPHVTHLALLCSFLLPAGVSLVGALGGQPAPIHDIRPDGSLLVGGPGPEATFYNDLPPDEARRYAAMLVPHTWAAVTAETTGAAWLRLPTSYLVCERDQAIPAAGQRAMIAGADEALRKEGQGRSIRVESCGAGHSPFLSVPGRVVEFVRRSVGEDV